MLSWAQEDLDKAICEVGVNDIQTQLWPTLSRLDMNILRSQSISCLDYKFCVEDDSIGGFAGRGSPQVCHWQLKP